MKTEVLALLQARGDDRDDMGGNNVYFYAFLFLGAVMPDGTPGEVQEGSFSRSFLGVP